MEEIRKDPVVGEWVIISAARGKRPSDYNKPNNTTNKEEEEGEGGETWKAITESPASMNLERVQVRSSRPS